ncbi:hypothetical protein TNIN_308221 [Trichonephila inaurata madagascariensis]|uniref:Uncharacterized protein n=1 Tax=Trichonephila inaurata madagascariensis TaxID=2747483 RepID=A0A8X6WQE9_9ARAC|nr:hypothetical protein TNIN_308221 [Trichonephila inaurata madagascariensis]
MGFEALYFSEERVEVVDFSITYNVLEKGFATKEPGQMPKITAFTYPFTLNAWIYALMIVATTVFFGKVIFKNATPSWSFLSVLGSTASQAVVNVRHSLEENTFWFVADHRGRHAFFV